jgi:hypothetical protein
MPDSTAAHTFAVSSGVSSMTRFSITAMLPNSFTSDRFFPLRSDVERRQNCLALKANAKHALADLHVVRLQKVQPNFVFSLGCPSPPISPSKN